MKLLRSRKLFWVLVHVALIILIVFLICRANPDTANPDSIRPVQREVDDFDSPEPVTTKESPPVNTIIDEKPYLYAVVDLDLDGTEELLLEYDNRGDIVIFNTQNEKTNAYRIGARSCKGLKTDGTMDWSSSASESGVHRLSFSENGIISEDIIVYDTEKNIFKVDDKIVTEEECIAALREQWNKTDVEWNLIPEEEEI